MIVRDLERLLNEYGISAAKIDAVTRKLRETARLPKGGRGANAPQIGPKEAALILIAMAGSPKGNNADVRMDKLERLRSKSVWKIHRDLTVAVEQLLSDRHVLAQVSELRVGRTTRYAAIHKTDGEVEEFVENREDKRPDRFSVEGVLPRTVLERVALALRDNDEEDWAR